MTDDMTGDAIDLRSIGVVVGENLLRLRQERRLTQHEAARQCQAVGLNWTRVRVAAIERGDRETVDLGTLLLLAEAFEVSLAEFFAGAGNVLLSDGAAQSLAGVRQALSSGARRSTAQEDRPVLIHMTSPKGAASARLILLGTARGVRRETPAGAGVEADEALAARLGLDVNLIFRAASALWGSTLTDERDRRVQALGDLDPGERQAHRGHITRELAQEIERSIGGEAG